MPTLWQLKVLVAAARADTWAELAGDLGLDKYQVERNVSRLAEKLGIERGLLVELDGRPHVPAEWASLVERAEEVLFGYEKIEERARQTDRILIIRVDGYWSHIEHFFGALIGEFERSHDGVRIELVPWFGSRRDQAGTGLTADLRDRKTDLVIAPTDPALPSDGTALDQLAEEDSDEDGASALPVRGLPMYRWALAAAVRPRHPLRDYVKDGLIDLDDLATVALDFPVIAAPPHHASRKLLESHQTPSRRIPIASTSPEPAALVSLGAKSSRIPLIPTDSQVAWRSDWPILVARSDRRRERRILGGSYTVYWRETDQPRTLVPLLRQLALDLQGAAADFGRTRSQVDLPMAMP